MASCAVSKIALYVTDQSVNKKVRAMGRPKNFDPETAIAAVKELFWLQGYEGTSLQDIELATGLAKQSLYREFGDKRGIYLAALRHYEQHEAAEAARVLAQHDNPRDAFAALFAIVIAEAESSHRRGCFLCNAGADRTMIDPAIGTAVSDAMERLAFTFARKLDDADPLLGRARALVAFYVGLRISVRAGSAFDPLVATVRHGIGVFFHDHK